MNSFIGKYKLRICGVVAGAILGYAYYHFIGCVSGSCAITSRPLTSAGYGMIMGYLMCSAFDKPKRRQSHVELD